MLRLSQVGDFGYYRFATRRRIHTPIVLHRMANRRVTHAMKQVAARLSVFGLLMLACAAILLAYEQVGSSPTLPKVIMNSGLVTTPARKTPFPIPCSQLPFASLCENVDLNSRLKQLKSLQNRLENGGLNQARMVL